MITMLLDKYGDNGDKKGHIAKCARYLNILTVDAVHLVLKIDSMGAPATANYCIFVDSALIEYV